MAASMSLLEEDLSCPVCTDVFHNPVVLRCSHSFCSTCLDQHWGASSFRDCPVCRRAAMEEPVLNLTLRNTCESFLRERERETAVLCLAHGQRAELFCIDDKQPVCKQCQKSTRHWYHKVCKLENAVEDSRRELLTALKPLMEKLEALTDETVGTDYIQTQAQYTKREIEKEFEKLHQFLREEEEARIAALREEEEQKSKAMKEKINREISLLSDTIDVIKQDMKAGSILFLQDFEDTLKRAQSIQQDQEIAQGALIDVAKHLGNLKYRVWEKMLTIIQHTPVILDPNTAHSALDLSEELTCVRVRKRRRMPVNPERFDRCVCVVGTEGFGAGRHVWDVDVGDNTEWTLGVATESATRKGKLSLSTAEGFLAIRLKGEELLALTSPATRLSVGKKPRRIRVMLKWQSILQGGLGLVTFTDLCTGTSIHTFEHRSTEKMFPIFSPGHHPGRLQILPATVSVTVEQPGSFFEKYWFFILCAIVALCCIVHLLKEQRH